ncbi:Eukaryotic aspartyl protease [Aphelenchoides fujianensis]|nr:Eukaryotic aspartyl protease [Aphelenchoides fujianensis]
MTPLGHSFSGLYEDYDVTGNRFFASVAYHTVGAPTPLLNQTFAIVEPLLNPDDTSEFQCDGVLGLAWAPASYPVDVVSPIRNIFAALPGTPQFYVLHVERPTPPAGNPPFQIAFGQDIPECGTQFSYTLAYFEMPADNGIQYFYLNGVRYGDQELASANDPFSVDAGMPVILMPYEVLRIVLSQMPYRYNYDLQMYTIDCARVNTLKDLVFETDDLQFVVPATQYVADVRYCFL